MHLFLLVEKDAFPSVGQLGCLPTPCRLWYRRCVLAQQQPVIAQADYAKHRCCFLLLTTYCEAAGTMLSLGSDEH